MLFCFEKKEKIFILITMILFFNTYKRYILTVIIVTILFKWSSRQFWTSQDLMEPSRWWDKFLVISQSGYNNITGILLDGPSSQNWRQRSQIMGNNTAYIRWRIYDITDRNVKSRMKSKSKSTPLSLIVEQDKYKQYRDDFGNLQKEFADSDNITLLSDRNLGINNMHAKTFVGEKWRVIQTANLNRTSFYDNREHFFFGTDETIRQNLLDLFVLDSKTILDKKKHKAEYLTLTQRLSPNLLVCPLNCRQKLEFLLNSAQQSIWISAQYITDERIINILRNKSDLDIRVLTNDMYSNKDLVRHFWPKIVQFESPKQYNHDKMLIIDDNKMLIGSMNFSQNALDNNREIGIIMLDQKLIERQRKLFL